jgi:hypothetical protein
MTAENEEFIYNVRETCRDAQNHFYSVRIKQNDVDPELPFWMKKIAAMEHNCTLFLEGKISEIQWQRSYKTLR